MAAARSRPGSWGPQEARMVIVFAMFTVKELQGRGRGLVTTGLIKGGQSILEEEPLVLTVAQEYKDAACATCLKLLHPGPGESTRVAAARCAARRSNAVCMLLQVI